MKVFAYVSTDRDACPPGEEAIARIRTGFTGAKGKSVEDWHPVIFTGPDAETVTQTAHDWWDAELEKEVRRQANYAAAGDRLRARKGAPQ